MKIFCIHKWQVVSETTTKSAFDVVLDSLTEKGYEAKNLKGLETERFFIQVVACEKCGKLKRYKEVLP